MSYRYYPFKRAPYDESWNLFVVLLNLLPVDSMRFTSLAALTLERRRVCLSVIYDSNERHLICCAGRYDMLCRI